MIDLLTRQRSRTWWLIALAVLLTGTTGVLALVHFTSQSSEPVAVKEIERSYGSPLKIQHFCGSCHAYPPADTLPRSVWKAEVEQAYGFFAESNLPLDAPPMAKVIKYFEDGAPEELPWPDMPRAARPLPLHFDRSEHPAPAASSPPAIANVNLVHLFDDRRLDVLACDMHTGRVMALRPYDASQSWQVLATLSHPAHAEVVDLDGDGVKDILVADLGSLERTDERCGKVVWLRGNKDGSFTPITLLEGVGRVADVQAADFRGVGKLDLVVAVFGWRKTGEIIYLENQTTDWSRPKFARRVLDERHGAIHVPVGDIDGDGRPDFVALLSQEHETIVAFLNQGNGEFRKETIYAGPHPAYGSTGIQLVDLNGDGKLDVLYTNGDSMEKPFVLKAYHGVQWLENQGRFPFVHHPLAPLFGAYRAVAADFRGRGLADIVAVSYLPPREFPQRGPRELDAIIYLEQTSPGRFARQGLEKSSCDHVTCAAGDIFATGKIDFVTGNISARPGEPAVTIWKNQENKTP